METAIMPDFYQTQRGAKFFDGQLPSLIRRMEKIGSELERANDLKEKALQPGSIENVLLFEGGTITELQEQINEGVRGFIIMSVQVVPLTIGYIAIATCAGQCKCAAQEARA
jgi:hypothetical protein